MKPESLSPPLLDQKSTDSPIWMGVGVVTRLYEKDFPNEAEFLRAETRRCIKEVEYFLKTNPQAFAHIKYTGPRFP